MKNDSTANVVNDNKDIDNDVITVKYVINKLNDGSNIKNVAKELGIGKQRLGERLHSLKYKYNQSIKEWEWVGKGQEPLDKEFIESLKENKQTSTISPSTTVDLIKEVRELKELLQNQEVSATQELTTNPIDDLFSRIIELNQEEKARKTLVINKKIGEDLDEFFEKYKGKIYKSDIIEIALLDFFSKYN